MTIEPNGLYHPAAPELRVVAAVQTLARWRHEGKGPSYLKAGTRVIYRGGDVLKWLESRRVDTQPQSDVV